MVMVCLLIQSDLSMAFSSNHPSFLATMASAPRLSLPSSVYGQTLCPTFGFFTLTSAYLQIAFRRSSHNSRWRAAGGPGKELAESGSVSGDEEASSLSAEKPRKGSGVGFGQVGSSGSKPIASSSKGPKENKRAASSKDVKEGKKSATVRRVTPAKPVIASQMDPKAQQIETAFVLSLAFLGVVILGEGLVLAATGFLPEVWDDFFVTYLYPSFTPTVGVFLIGAVGYGLYKTLGVGSKRS